MKSEVDPTRMHPVGILAGLVLLLALGAPISAQDLPDAPTADPDHYTVEFENDVIRILRIRYGPGERSVMHTHPASCGIFLTEPTFEMTLPDGSPPEPPEPSEAGDVSCVDAEAHLPANTGDSTAELILVELKGQETLD